MKKGIVVIALLLVSHCLTGQTIFWKKEWKNERPVVTQFNKTEQIQGDNKLDTPLFHKSNIKISKSLIKEKSRRDQINYRRSLENVMSSTVVVFPDDKTFLSREVYYERPQGYFFWGHTEDHFYFKDMNWMIGPSYVPATWKNHSCETIEEFKWIFPNPNIDETSPIILTEKNPTITYGYVNVYPPILTAYNQQKEIIGTYQWKENKGGVFLGGTPTYDSKRFGVGNYDYSLKYTNGYNDIPDQYRFGTGSEAFWEEKGLKLDAIGNYFEKPIHKYAVDKVFFSCDNFSAEPDAELTLIIHRVSEEGLLLDTIATSTCKGSEAEFIRTDKYGDDNYNIPFTFKKFNPETGNEEEVYLEISDAIFMELKGFIDEKVYSFAPYYQAYSSPSKENNASVWMYVTQEDGTSERILIEVPDLYEDLYTSFLFNMYFTYPYLVAEEDTFYVPAKGGMTDFYIYSYWSPQTISYDKEVADWIEIDDLLYEEDEELCFLYVKVKPSNEEESRSAEIKLKTLAADLTLHVIQEAGNLSTTVTESASKEIKVIKSDSYYELHYPIETTSLTIFNSLGNVIQKVTLPEGGTHFHSIDKLPEGVYIFQFNGKENSSLKVIK